MMTQLNPDLSNLKISKRDGIGYLHIEEPIMKKVIIMVGASGSGKSTWAESYCYQQPMGVKISIVSADNYFKLNDEGEYRFKPSELSFAHDYCKYNFAALLSVGYDVVIVDNTNTRKEERYFYEKLAYFHGYEVLYQYMDEKDPTTLAERNVHGVPIETIKAQLKRIEENK